MIAYFSVFFRRATWRALGDGLFATVFASETLRRRHWEKLEERAEEKPE